MSEQMSVFTGRTSGTVRLPENRMNGRRVQPRKPPKPLSHEQMVLSVLDGSAFRDSRSLLSWWTARDIRRAVEQRYDVSIEAVTAALRRAKAKGLLSYECRRVNGHYRYRVTG